MCHGYELRWYQRETAAKKKAKEAVSEIVRAARQKETAKAVSEDKVEEKELVPAE